MSLENGILDETQDKDVVSECLSSIAVYDQWVAPPVQGARPRARYEVFSIFILASLSGMGEFPLLSVSRTLSAPYFT